MRAAVYTVTDLVEASRPFVRQISRNRAEGMLGISQDKCDMPILERYRMSESNPVRYLLNKPELLYHIYPARGEAINTVVGAAGVNL